MDYIYDKCSSWVPDKEVAPSVDHMASGNRAGSNIIPMHPFIGLLHSATSSHPQWTTYVINAPLGCQRKWWHPWLTKWPVGIVLGQTSFPCIPPLAFCTVQHLAIHLCRSKSYTMD